MCIAAPTSNRRYVLPDLSGVVGNVNINSNGNGNGNGSTSGDVLPPNNYNCVNVNNINNNSSRSSGAGNNGLSYDELAMQPLGSTANFSTDALFNNCSSSGSNSGINNGGGYSNSSNSAMSSVSGLANLNHAYHQDNVYTGLTAAVAASAGVTMNTASAASSAGAASLPALPSAIAVAAADAAVPTTTTAVTCTKAMASYQLGKPKPRFKRRRRGPQLPGKTATNKERLFVQHNYHDLANEPDIPPEGLDQDNDDFAATEAGTAIKKPHTPLSIDSFPMKLHRILEQIESEGLSKIVAWQPHGRSFLIRDYPLFVSVIMPRYFPKVKKLTSLQRQLNLYGFERLTREGPDEGAYYHECFLRGRPGLTAQRMVRKRVKGTGYKAASNPSGEPDLYAYPFVEEVLKLSNSASNQGQGQGLLSSFQQQDQCQIQFSQGLEQQGITMPQLQNQIQTVTEFSQSGNVANGGIFHQGQVQVNGNNNNFHFQKTCNESVIVTDSSRNADRDSWSTESGSHDDASHGHNSIYNQQLQQQQQWHASSIFMHAMQNSTQGQEQQQGLSNISFSSGNNDNGANINNNTRYSSPLLSSNASNNYNSAPQMQFQFNNDDNIMANNILTQSFNTAVNNNSNIPMINVMNNSSSNNGSNGFPQNSISFNSFMNQSQGFADSMNNTVMPSINNVPSFGNNANCVNVNGSNNNGPEDNSVLMDFADLWEGDAAVAMRRQNFQEFMGRIC